MDDDSVCDICLEDGGHCIGLRCGVYRRYIEAITAGRGCKGSDLGSSPPGATEG
jgi:hypothetical protein